MPRSGLEAAAKRLAGALREAGEYPAPANPTFYELARIIRELEKGDGLSVSSSEITDVVERLADHLNRLLEAHQRAHTMSRATYPQLDVQIQRLLRFRDLYLEERARTETS